MTPEVAFAALMARAGLSPDHPEAALLRAAWERLRPQLDRLDRIARPGQAADDR